MSNRTGGKTGGPYGSKNGASKLTEDDVRAIRARYFTGVNTGNARELGREFNINRRTVLSIVQGVTWGWLDDGA